MDLKVKEEFRDKYTGEVYTAGKTIKVEKKRGEELLKSPYVVVEEKTTEKSSKKDKKEENPEAVTSTGETEQDLKGEATTPGEVTEKTEKE